MKRFIKLVFTSFLLLNSTLTIAQNYYYWANGEKYALELYPEKQYILIQNQKKSAIAESLKVLEENISDIETIRVSKTINNHSTRKPLENDLYWTFVRSSIDKEKVISSDIIYAAPSFLRNGNEVSLSNFFYVKLKQEKDIEILESFAKENLVEIVGNDSFMPLWFILSCDKNSKGNTLEMANLFYESGYFDSAEPDLMTDFLLGCTDDPLFGEQWHLNNTGQAGGTVGNDIGACQAWTTTMGCTNVVVAVLDQGLEFNHPDFNNISTLSFDTHNGASPSIVRGNHGVSVAGVIGATIDNNIGVAGIAPGAQLMSISNDLVISPLLSQRLSNGINFAWQNGASIINNSWGSNSIQQQGLINDAINNAVTQGRGGLGTIVICITHNQNSNSISFPSNNPQTIAVGAINRTSSRASFSNYGIGIDIVAPGESIRTTDRQGILGYNTNAGILGDYTILDGTSFAAPQVAGVAALILSVNPALTQQEVRNILESTTDKVGSYNYTLGAGEQASLTWNNEMGYGRLNAHAAVQAALPTITGPSLVCTSDETFTVQNVPPDVNVTWSVSPASLFAVDAGTGNSFATRATSSSTSGQGTVTATLAGVCGNIVVSINVQVGAPSPGSISGNSSICLAEANYYTVPYNVFNNSYSWSVRTSTGGLLPAGNFTIQQQPSGTYGSKIKLLANVTGNYRLYCTIGTACRITHTIYKNITVNVPGTSGCGGMPEFVDPSAYFTLYPNPSDDYLEVCYCPGESGEEMTIHLIDSSPDLVPEYELKLFNMQQRLSRHLPANNNSVSKIDVKDLPPGVYYLNIITKSGTYKRQVLIE